MFRSLRKLTRQQEHEPIDTSLMRLGKAFEGIEKRREKEAEEKLRTVAVATGEVVIADFTKSRIIRTDTTPPITGTDGMPSLIQPIPYSNHPAAYTAAAPEVATPLQQLSHVTILGPIQPERQLRIVTDSDT